MASDTHASHAAVAGIDAGPALTRAGSAALQGWGAPASQALSPSAEQMLRRELTGSEVGLPATQGRQAARALVDDANGIADAAGRQDLLGVLKGLASLVGLIEKLLKGKAGEQPAANGHAAPSAAPGAADTNDAADERGPIALIKRLIQLLKKLGFGDQAIESLLSNALRGTGLEQQVPALLAAAGSSPAGGSGIDTRSPLPAPRGALQA